MAMAHGGLAKLAEELGELQQVVGKLLAYPSGNHPDGGPPLLERFVDEAGDVWAAIVFAAGKHPELYQRLVERSETKFATFQEWDAQP